MFHNLYVLKLKKSMLVLASVTCLWFVLDFSCWSFRYLLHFELQCVYSIVIAKRITEQLVISIQIFGRAWSLSTSRKKKIIICFRNKKYNSFHYYTGRNMNNFHREKEAKWEKKSFEKEVQDPLHNSRSSKHSYISNLGSKLGCGQKWNSF